MASPANFLRAADARVTIDGIAFAISGWERGGRVAEIDVSNTEGYAGNLTNANQDTNYQSVLPDIRRGNIGFTIEAFDSNNNIFDSPFLIHEGAYYDIVYFPAGLNGPASPYGSCLCVYAGDSGRVGQGGARQRVEFVTDGRYLHPNEPSPDGGGGGGDDGGDEDI